jgi:hypothetical protein
VTVAAPPRPPSSADLQDRRALEALIEEARRRARRRRRRRRNGAVVVLATLAAAATFIGLGHRGGGGTAASSGPAGSRSSISAAAGRFVVITMRGHVLATRTLHPAGGSVHYREAGRFRVVWRMPASALRLGRSFRSASATVTGTTSAIFDNSPAKSCRGALTVGRKPFELRVVHTGYDPLVSFAASTIGVSASPSPIATAVSPTCARGLLASHWGLSVPQDQRSPPSEERRRAWWIYNHPGGGFYGKNFTPVPKGGDSEGWVQGWGPAGSFAWLAVFSGRGTARSAHQ